MRRRISIRGRVRPSVRRSVGPSVRMSRVIFEQRIWTFLRRKVIKWYHNQWYDEWRWSSRIWCTPAVLVFNGWWIWAWMNADGQMMMDDPCSSALSISIAYTNKKNVDRVFVVLPMKFESLVYTLVTSWSETVLSINTIKHILMLRVLRPRLVEEREEELRGDTCPCFYPHFRPRKTVKTKFCTNKHRGHISS